MRCRYRLLAAPPLCAVPKGFVAVKDSQDGYAFLYPFGWQEVSVDGQVRCCRCRSPSFMQLAAELRSPLLPTWDMPAATGSNHPLALCTAPSAARMPPLV